MTSDESTRMRDCAPAIPRARSSIAAEHRFRIRSDYSFLNGAAQRASREERVQGARADQGVCPTLLAERASNLRPVCIPQVYTGFIPMKTAISISDDLLRAGDRAAKQLGVSRSRLFSMALQDYLRSRHKGEIAEQLKRAYSDDPSTEERDLTKGYKSKLRNNLDRW